MKLQQDSQNSHDNDGAPEGLTLPSWLAKVSEQEWAHVA